MQKPGLLTIFSRSTYIKNAYQDIKDLTLALNGQLIPAEGGQEKWLSQGGSNLLIFMKIIMDSKINWE
jgi:hypothetical protein